ncbi:MAG: hypothetical protein U5K37_11535 [Natrialbaceae archaeon]|nr:hypothetical protein [Natrialbaceae archaeon]
MSADVYTYEFSQDGDQYLYDGEYRDIESEERRDRRGRCRKPDGDGPEDGSRPPDRAWR